MKKSKSMAESGQYMTFILADQDYGIAIDTVREIIQMNKITPYPQTPDFIKGVINLRDRIIPVVDLRLKFGMTVKEITKRTCIIIINVAGDHIGIIIDAVNEVIEFKSEQIEKSPKLGERPEETFVTGVGKIEDRMILLVDIEEILSQEKINMKFDKSDIENIKELENETTNVAC